MLFIPVGFPLKHIKILAIAFLLGETIATMWLTSLTSPNFLKEQEENVKGFSCWGWSTPCRVTDPYLNYEILDFIIATVKQW